MSRSPEPPAPNDVPKLFRAAADAGVAVVVALRGEPGPAVYAAEAVGRMLGYEPAAHALAAVTGCPAHP
ncbi:MAG: hypothetical protein L6Q84_35985 [Polyangiaceae bacterium]|nr:hypothetical protein [Polyangiaceae bacterium]